MTTTGIELEKHSDGDDYCDLCMTSGVNAERTTHCGKTIGIECGCDNSHPDGCCDDAACEDCKRPLMRSSPAAQE